MSIGLSALRQDNRQLIILATRLILLTRQANIFHLICFILTGQIVSAEAPQCVLAFMAQNHLCGHWTSTYSLIREYYPSQTKTRCL